MPRRVLKRISLQEIHNAIALATSAFTQDPVEVPQEENGESTKTLQAVRNGTESSPFHDALHEYSIFARPATTSDLLDLLQLVAKLISLCGTRKLSWKVLTLTAFLRRYHAKAPEARTDEDQESVGDGERLLFYVTLLTLRRFWLDLKDKTPEQAQFAYEAAACMIRSASRIGGSRDLCAIIEHLSMARLVRGGNMGGDPPESFADKLVPAVSDVAFRTQPGALLELALVLAARQLDDDLSMLHSVDDDEKDKNLLSTIHVMIPHNRRGSNTKGSWQRKLANSVAEILIWQRTSVAQSDVRFAKALEKLALLSPTALSQGHSLIQQLQTTARKQRQLLNEHARKQGFLLTSSYLMDKTSLTLGQVRRAKAGDLRMLEKLARKHRDSRVLALISKRNLDPTKATAAASIEDLMSGWLDIAKDYEDDEVSALELSMQTNTVLATLENLRCPSNRDAWITCVGDDKNNLVCAILVAAALEKSHLYLAGEEHDVSTMEKCIELLNQVIVNEKFVGAEPVSIEDFLSSKVETSQDVVVLSSRDLELDENVLKDMQDRDIAIRVHATQRIKAIGDVILSLNTDVYDRIKAREPMSLGVMLDCTGSMGNEIEGCKKGVLDMISTFRGLAPVGSVNIMGYWDPVNVRSDPQPKSTGYLEANKENMKVLQQFVNKELVCQGGGDEPEDIPKALERYIVDMKKAELSAHKGVHFLFFIADAGFRNNETARVEAALQTLRKMGVIMVMCQVRSGSSLQTMVQQAQECFKGVGRYVELQGTGQLATIAASVTESIRASLFQSNVVAVTASVGSTIDAIRKLAAFQRDNASLKKTEELAKLTNEEPCAEADVEMEDTKADEAASVDEEMKVEEEEDTKVGEEMKVEEEEPIKVFAKKKEFTLTSRDRLYLQLSRLPKICHEQVVVAFGGKSLQVISAEKIANKLREEDIPLSEVEKAGYPREILELVQNLMAGHGVERVED
jgi:hypothetical protein